jgi:hypothetical protein
MGWLIPIGFGAALFIAIFVFLWRNPAYRAQRKLAKSMSRVQRRRIWRAMWRGEAVADPREAALALQWAEHARALRKPALQLPLGVELGLLGFFLLGVLVTRHWVGLITLLVPLVGFLWFRSLMKRMYRRADASLAKNRELAKQFAGTSELRDT